jgi:hypothetical protein
MKLGRTDHLMANLPAGTQEAQCRSWPFVVGSLGSSSWYGEGGEAVGPVTNSTL